MKTLIYTATKGSKEDTMLYSSLKDLNLLDNAIFIENNKESLSIVYNRAIDIARIQDVDVLVLCHDDIYIRSTDFVDRVEKSTNRFDMFGVAGVSKCSIGKPSLWHIMGRKNTHGEVYHGKDKPTATYFGEFPHRVLLIDGVFMAITNKVFSKIKFDIENPANFHFYDLDYSLQCNSGKFTVGVSDVSITHNSPGLDSLENVEWLKGQEWFLNKWLKRK